MASVLSTKLLTSFQKELFIEAGIAFVDLPFIEIEPIHTLLPSYFKNVIVTSQNAAKRLIDACFKVDHVYCVGEKTANLLSPKYGVREVCPNSKALSEVIVAKYASEAFVFLSGNMSLDTIPKTLQTNKIKCRQIEVYKTVIKPTKIENTFDAVLFFSPSAVRSFLEYNTIGEASCICIGKTTASELMGKAKSVVISSEETIKGVILTTITLFKK